MFSLFGTISKLKAFAQANSTVFAVRRIADMFVFHSGITCREKLQIMYANIRV